ncbi:MAG: hypothetical protein HY594_03105 [Candidatus Omnitrophica bacterium]|nr:hypothetical protein [Candidatus Omnitrophota bacterium]
MTSSGLMAPSLWLLGATAVANATNLLYQLFMVRNLSPDHYAMLSALIGLMTLLAVPSATLQATTSQSVARWIALGDWTSLRQQLRRRLFFSMLVAVLLLIAVAALHADIMAFLRFPDRPAVVFAWGIAVALAFVAPVLLGALQGMQAFTSFGLNMVLGSILKLIIGIVLVVKSASVLGATQALSWANAAALGLGVIQMRASVRRRDQSLRDPQSIWTRALSWVSDGINECYVVLRKPPGIPRYGIGVALGVMAYTSLTNADLILVKHYFDPSTAGSYAVGAMVARMVLFLPMAFSMVLFPKVSHMAALGQDARPLLRKVMAATAFLSGLAAAVCFLIPEWPMRILAGRIIPEAVPVVRLLSLAMAAMAVSNLALVYLLALQKIRWVVPFMVGAAIHATLIALWPASLTAVAWITLCIAAALALYSVMIAQSSWAAA